MCTQFINSIGSATPILLTAHVAKKCWEITTVDDQRVSV